MNGRFAVFGVVLCALIASGVCGCDDSEPEDSASVNDLTVQVMEGMIYADLEPPVPPDPIVCRLSLRMVNTNPDYAITGISIPSATVFLSRDSRELGTILLASDWDGIVGVGEVDTVTVTKTGISSGAIDPPCGETVFLRVRIVKTTVQAKQVSTPSYVFSCPMAAARENP